MAEDQRKVFDTKLRELEQILETATLNAQDKRQLRTAMEFAYAAAFSAARYDMQAAPWQAQGYQDKYERLLKRLD
jgi:hypothetical protein